MKDTETHIPNVYEEVRGCEFCYCCLLTYIAYSHSLDAWQYPTLEAQYEFLYPVDNMFKQYENKEHW